MAMSQRQFRSPGLPLGPEDVTFISASKNLFSPDDPDAKIGYYITHDTGIELTNPAYNVTGFIPVNPDLQYSISYVNRRAFYDANKTFISGELAGPATFTPPAGTFFARFSVITAKWPEFQVEQGAAPTAYVPFGSRIDLELMPVEVVQNDEIDSVMTADGAPRANPYRPELLRIAKYKLTKRVLGEAAQLHIAAAGDSYTHSTERWIGPFATYMTGKFGDAGGGWCGFGFGTSTGQVAPWTGGNQPAYRQGNARPSAYATTLYGSMTSTYAANPSASPDLATSTLTQAGDYITQTIPATPVHNGCDLFFVGTADGVVRYNWNGAGWNTVNVQGTVGAVQSVPIITGLPAGAGTLTVEWVSGTVKLCGVVLKSAASGVMVSKLALTGSSVGQWSGAPATQWEAGIGLLAPDTFILLDGTNSQAGFTPSVWYGHTATIIDRLRVGKPGLDILLATPPENMRGLANKMTDYADQARRLAMSKRVAFVDMQDAFGNPDAPTEYNSASPVPLFNVDGIHPEPATGGRSMLAEFLRAVLPFGAGV
jgi:hypothetical protein